MTALLKIVLGPMFSGKTTSLIHCYQNLEISDAMPVVIKYKGDTESTEHQLVSHDNEIIDCISTYSLATLWFDMQNPNYTKLHESKIVLINEAQFFDDLFEVVISILKSKKHVFIYGLDSDSRQKKFGQIWDLIPYANSVKKLTAKCECGSNDAIFTHRITDLNTEQVFIGAAYYIPLCRDCLPLRRHPNNI
jgi:thymidine kinase